jgi:flagellar motor switch protein FliM
MEKVFTKEEIHALIGVASSRQEKGRIKETRSITACNFRQSGQLTGEQFAAVNGLHEGFSRSLTQSLGAYLRVNFDVRLVSIEQPAYNEYLTRVPDITYMVGFQIEPMSAAAAMQIDHSLVFPLVDILLGGVGKCEVFTRDISEIEEQVMEEVAKIICRELETAWTPLGTKIHLDRRQSRAQMQRFLAPTERTLCLSFEVKLAEITGKLNLIFPASVSNTLLRKLSTDQSYVKSRPADSTGVHMAAKMLDCQFPLELGIPAIKLPINTLTGLVPQMVYNLGIPVRKPASLFIGGRGAHEANPVRRGRMRAAQVGSPLVSSAEERKA